jgi:hypothetical protein
MHRRKYIPSIVEMPRNTEMEKCSKVQVGIWTLRARGGMVTGRCLLCIGESKFQSIFHLLLKYPETQRWRRKLLYNKRSHINKEPALRKTLTVKNVTEQRQLGAISYQIKCKWENQVKKGEVRKGVRENQIVSSINRF